MEYMFNILLLGCAIIHVIFTLYIFLQVSDKHDLQLPLNVLGANISTSTVCYTSTICSFIKFPRKIMDNAKDNLINT